ncbi:MAG: protein translocase subunit SecF [Gemmatimonadetes bacterium]|nr:protein translocase subunit SecF [Gemmatimonadota bacterium]
MFRFFDKADYDILKMRKNAAIVAFGFMIPGLLLLAVRGLNQSIEFTGGTLIELRAISQDIDTEALRSAIRQSGIEGAEITRFGSPNEFIIRARLDPRAEVTEESTQATRAAIEGALENAFGTDSYDIVRTDAIGPKVGGELRQKAILAILMGFAAIFLYLSVRMEWRFAIAAVAATIHDILSSLAFVSYFNIEVTLAVATALLFIVGYSVNDTIVTFDRVRENLHKFRRKELLQILNRSINETLPRTVITSGTTIAATMALVLLGPQVLRGFALVMTFGVVTGTFSSIFIASPILLAVEQKWPGEDVRGARSISQGTTVVQSPKENRGRKAG